MSSRIYFGILPIGNKNLKKCKHCSLLEQAHTKFLSFWNSLEFSLRLRQSASWICFALTELRLRGFAPVGFFCSLTGLVSLRPSGISLIRKPLTICSQSAAFRKNFSVFTNVLFLLDKCLLRCRKLLSFHIRAGILRITSPYAKTLHLLLAFSAFHFAPACGKSAV